MGEPPPSRADPADHVPAVQGDEVAITQPGDSWICGDHGLHCGSPQEASSYSALLGGESADLVIADPFHNVSGVRPDGKSRTFKGPGALAAQLSSDELTEFLTTISAQIASNVTPGAIIFFRVDWPYLEELAAATRRYFGKPRDLVVWCKADAARGSFYRSQHEHIAVYVAGPTPSAKVPLHGRGRHRSNVWTGYHMPGRDSMQKPVALLVDAIRDCSKRGDIVPFAGFGTTMFAAERTGRRA